jgi:hypothetical protein
MKVVYSLVRRPDLHTARGRLARTASGSFYWDKEASNPTDFAILAKKANESLVGIQKFDLIVRGRTRILDANSTFVWPMYRGISIAREMWTTAIQENRVTKVLVRVVSDKGKTLIETLSDQFPEVKFDMEEDGDRPLRSLKGKRKAA